MNENNDTAETGTTEETDLHYSWISYPENAPEEDQDERVLKLGGDTLFLHAEVTVFEDDSMALNLLSTGITTKADLVKYLQQVLVIAQHDLLEDEKQKRDS